MDKGSIRIDHEKSTLRFRAVTGKSLDLNAIHAALKTTRLGKSAGSQVSYLQLTAVGQITGKKELRLKVSGTNQELVLAEDPEAKFAKGESTPLQRLQKELGKRHGDVEITGRVDGWKGRFPTVLKKEVSRAPVLQVTGFRIRK